MIIKDSVILFFGCAGPSLPYVGFSLQWLLLQSTGSRPRRLQATQALGTQALGHAGSRHAGSRARRLQACRLQATQALRMQALGHAGSRARRLQARRLQATQALGHAGSRHAGTAVLVHGLSCSMARGIFPDQGSNRCPLHCKAHLKPLDHNGSPGKIPFKRRTVYSVIEIRIFSTHTQVLFQVILKTTKNEMKASGHLRSPKQALETRHTRGLSHTQDGGRLPRGPSRTCDGVDNSSKDGGRLYQFFEDVRLGSQWKPIVQHLFQHLVNHNHIVFYHWLRTDSKIILMKTQYIHLSLKRL